jgi:eukaryotic-like serine/threonine-protein kinase
MSAPTIARPAAAHAVRHLGRFQLLRLLAKSSSTMVWLVSDPRSGQEQMLVIPREKPHPQGGQARWLELARRTARTDHPGLAVPLEVDVQEDWPYIAYERHGGALLTERLGRQGLPVSDLVPGMVQAIEGLAFAHEAGQVHGDLHAAMVLVPDSGRFQLIGLGALPAPPEAGTGLVAQRQRAERDVLAVGLVLHHALVGQPALGDADVMHVMQQMAPLGREVVRLPWGDTQVIAEPLRAIVNRATDRQERQRYRNARTLSRALSGWLRSSGDSDDGPMAMLLDRMRVVGLLPAMPGGLQRARRLHLLHRERIDELAAIVLEDPGLSFELLRAVNVATRRVGAVASNGPILTVRRAVTMLGLDGVRRAAQALKPWPGPLNEAQAADLARQFDLARRAGQVARWVRPPGYDGELVYLLALMQRLGRLVVQYHFPEEAAQIRRLVQAVPAAKRGDPDEPGMSPQGASFAVLGFDLEALGLAVGRYWGLDSAALLMMRPMPTDGLMHAPDNDIDRLRMTASCANEVIDCQALPVPRRTAALLHVATRYGRALGISAQDLQQYAQGQAPDDREPVAAPPADEEPGPPA